MKTISKSLAGIMILIILVGVVYYLMQKPAAVYPAKKNPLDKVPKGHFLTSSEVKRAFALFHDQYLVGGQEKNSPRIIKWVNPNTFVFLEFDSPKQSDAKKLQFIGIGVKGVYCSEARPDRSFSHFLKYDAPVYDQADTLKPGDQGYWMSFTAVDTFIYDKRKDTPGIDYQYDLLTPPSCDSVPVVSFTPSDAKDLSHDDIMALSSYFNDNKTIFYGGQTAPRISKWVNPDAFIFLQFDNQSDVTKASALRYVGLGVRGQFCSEMRPSADFVHLHMPVAKLYAFGHASRPKDGGYWLMGIAVGPFTSNGRDISPEIDRRYNIEEIPSCNGVNNPSRSMHTMESITPSVTSEVSQSIQIHATEFKFTPNQLHLKIGQQVTIHFVNDGVMEHTFTVPAMHIDTGGLLPGHAKDITAVAPQDPGTYQALCAMGGHLQLGMKADIIVQ